MCIVAKKAFAELGELLQRSRQNDYWDTFSLYLENADEDPAVKDKELADKLACNRREGQSKLAAVFEEYVKKEEQLKEQIYNGINSEDMDDDHKNIDDDEDDDDEDENEGRDKNIDTLSLHTSSNEESDNVKDVDETRQNNVIPAERNNNKTVNVDRDINRIASDKTKRTAPIEEKCNNKTEVNTSTKENHVPVSKGENKTAINAERMSKSPVSDFTTSKSVAGTDAKTQANSVPTSTTNCADTNDRTEGL